MGFWDTIIGKDAGNAARGAAEDTYHKQRRATADIRLAGDEYANDMRGLAGLFDPYSQAGKSALNQLMLGLGIGGNGTSADFTNAYRALPGYQAGLDTGNRSVMAGANAGNMLQSGKALKALQQHGSNYEDQRVGDYLSRLMGTTTMGLGATGQQVSTIGQGLQGKLGTRHAAFGGDMASAGTIGQGNIAAANAEAAGMQNIMNMGGQLVGMGIGGFGGGGFGGFPGFGGGKARQSGFGSFGWGQ